MQSDPYYGGRPSTTSVTNHAHQSFTSLPALTTAGYGPPSTDFAVAVAPGALVVAAPSTGYGGYGVPPASNPYATANPYALVPVPTNPSTAPYQYTPSQSYPAAPAPYGNSLEAGSNPYGAPVPSANPYAAPTMAVATNPYAAPMTSEQPTNPYGVAAAPSNPYLAPVPANPYGVPAAATNPYGHPTEIVDSKSAWTPPAPITTQPNPYDSTVPAQPYETFNGGLVPQAVTPHAQQTPSSLGFGSPAPDFSGFTPAAEEKTTGGAQHLSTPFGNLTMNGLASVDEAAPITTQPTQLQSTSVVQSTFAKLASLDNFSVSSNQDAKRMNPFESPANASVGGGRSLADMAKNKVRTQQTVYVNLKFMNKILTIISLLMTEYAGERDYENANARSAASCRGEPIRSVLQSIRHAIIGHATTASQHLWWSSTSFPSTIGATNVQ